LIPSSAVPVMALSSCPFVHNDANERYSASAVQSALDSLTAAGSFLLEREAS